MKNKKSTETRASFIVRFLRGNAHCFIITIATAALVTYLDSVIPQLLRYTVDSLIGGGEPDLPAVLGNIAQRLGGSEFLRSRFYYVSIAVIVTALLSACLGYISRVSNSKGSELYAESLRNSLFSQIQRLPFTWHSKNNTGDIIQRCTSDVETVRTFVSGQFIELIRIVFIVIVASTMMFRMDVRVASAACAFLPVVALYSAVFHKKIGKRFREGDEAEGVLSTVAQENLTGVRVVRAFGRERYERDKFERSNIALADIWARIGTTMCSFWALSDLIACAQYLTVVLLCIVFSADGSITPGDCIAFIAYNGMLGWPVRQLGRVIAEMSKASVAIDRLRYIMDSETEDYEDAEALPVDFGGEIRFDNVSFGYTDARILDGVSFSIGGGKTLGIIGGTGSGKSTLAALLCRLYDLEPDCGEISVGGVPVNRIGRRRLRDNIGIVLQEPFLFSRTIRENIVMPLPEGEDAEESMRAAAAVACVDRTIEEFPQGYDTIVGERGVTLSGGQKQRVAIARTLMKRAPIMIFDDSLSAVDTETDAMIRGAISKSLGGVTTIIVTHRVASVMNADEILVLEHGRVAEYGTHAQLMASGGVYRKVWDIQTAGAAAAEADLAGADAKEA